MAFLELRADMSSSRLITDDEASVFLTVHLSIVTLAG
jgi:hypothetical protein